MSPPRPAVRYHGGKWKLADWIIRHFPPHRVYTEAFGGGGSVLLKKARSYSEIYNDLDEEMVNLFRVYRDHGAELRRAIELTPFARAEFRESYQPSTNSIEQARRTLVRSYQGFGSAAISGENTGFRANSNRSGTTPAHDWMNYPDSMPMLIDRLRGVVIENRQAVDVIRQHDCPQALHYVDPPYVHSTRSAKTRGNKATGKAYRYEMSDEEHVALSVALHAAEGHVILSGYRCELYDALYADWERIDRVAHADGARARVESLWISRPGRMIDMFGVDKEPTMRKGASL